MQASRQANKQEAGSTVVAGRRVATGGPAARQQAARQQAASKVVQHPRQAAARVVAEGRCRQLGRPAGKQAKL